jgi:hypothetical protein
MVVIKVTSSRYTDIRIKITQRTQRHVKVSAGKQHFWRMPPVTANGRMQDCVTLSVMEAELVAAIMCVQDMLYTKKILESMGSAYDTVCGQQGS